MTRSVRFGFIAAGLFSMAIQTPASAHHSFNMFDLGKTVTVTWTVKSYQWAMPHVWIQMSIMRPDGKMEDWGMECHAPNIIARRGWKSSTVRLGDKISVVMHPRKDGMPQGSLISVTLPNGQTLTNWD